MGTYTLKLLTDRVVGTGSFGVVFEAKIVETGEREWALRCTLGPTLGYILQRRRGRGGPV